MKKVNYISLKMRSQATVELALEASVDVEATFGVGEIEDLLALDATDRAALEVVGKSSIHTC